MHIIIYMLLILYAGYNVNIALLANKADFLAPGILTFNASLCGLLIWGAFSMKTHVHKRHTKRDDEV